MNYKCVPDCEKPREKLILNGVSSLSNQELLSILLKTGINNKSVYDLSSEILNKIDSINMLKEYDVNFFLEIKGIGIAKACEVVAAIELGKRIILNNKDNNIIVHSSNDVYLYMRYFLFNKTQEYFYCLYLNNKNQIIERKLLFMGTVNRSVVHPREVFKGAYLSSASGIICVHNHPSGDVNPSKEDICITKTLVDISKIQAIPILDHIIIGNDCYYSMADNMELFLWKKRLIIKNTW